MEEIVPAIWCGRDGEGCGDCRPRYTLDWELCPICELYHPTTYNCEEQNVHDTIPEESDELVGDKTLHRHVESIYDSPELGTYDYMPAGDPGELSQHEKNLIHRFRAMKAERDDRIQRGLARMEAERNARQQLLDRLNDTGHWTDARGRRLKISDMTPRHAGNAFRLLERSTSVMELQVNIGAEFSDQFERYDVRSFPVGRELYERSQQAPGLGDKLKDRRARRAFEKSKG